MKYLLVTLFIIFLFPKTTLATTPKRPAAGQPPVNISDVAGAVATPRLMSATACDPNDRNDCLAALDQPINLKGIQDLPSYALSLTQGKYMNDCFNGLNSLPAEGDIITIYFTDGYCDITSQQSGFRIPKINIDIRWANNSNNNFQKIFKDSQLDNQSADYINNSTEGKGKFSYNVSLMPESRSWLRTGDYPYDFQGNALTQFTLDMQSTENHLDDLQKWSKDNSIIIDLQNSFWFGQTSGLIDGKIASYWHLKPGYSQASISEFEFCPNGCKISAKEELKLSAALNNYGPDQVNGQIYSRARHEESYLGFGRGIEDSSTIGNNYTGAVEWTDFRVAKNDAREWQQKLFYPSSGVLTEFEGQTNSNIYFNPLLTTSNEQGNSRSVKSFKAQKAIQMGWIPGQQINNEVLETNNRGQISRSGQGSVQEYDFNLQGVTRNHFTILGNYDDYDTRMLVTSENLIAEDLINQRIDPWSYLWGFQYTQTYFPRGTIYVNGYFKATDKDATKFTLATPKFKLLPQNVVYLKSDKTNLTPQQIARYDQLINQLAAKGVSVVSRNIDSANSNPTYLRDVPNGSVIIGLGSFADLKLSKTSLDNRQMSLHTFNNNQCATQSRSMAQTILSSLVSGVSDQSVNSIYSDNLWLYTDSDLVSVLNGYAGC